MTGIGSYTDAAGVPRPVHGVRLVDSLGAPKDFYLSEGKEIFTTNTEREYSVKVRLVGTQDIATTTYHGFIDLSNASDFWPHIGTERLDFTHFALGIDKAAAARGSAKIGIITRVDAADADITWITSLSFLENDTPSLFIVDDVSPSQIKCGVTAGKLTNMASNDVSLVVAAINTGMSLTFGVDGQAFVPAIGDAVLAINTTTGGTLRYAFAAHYHGHPIQGA